MAEFVSPEVQARVVPGTGLVPVVLRINYGNNFKGEVCGFLPELATRLVSLGHAALLDREGDALPAVVDLEALRKLPLEDLRERAKMAFGEKVVSAAATSEAALRGGEKALKQALIALFEVPREK